MGGSSGAQQGAKAGAVVGATRGVAERSAERRGMDSETQSRTQYESSAADQSEQPADFYEAAPEVSGAREGLALIRQHQPEVVVLDLDANDAQDEHVRDEFDAAARDSCSALVVLGKARRYREALPDGQMIAKPYHYGPLLRTIERLLIR